jgi:hypothetical protein
VRWHVHEAAGNRCVGEPRAAAGFTECTRCAEIGCPHQCARRCADAAVAVADRWSVAPARALSRCRLGTAFRRP